MLPSMMNDKLFYYRAEVLSVVDGDTVKVRVDLGFRLYRDVSLRLDAINTPELRGEFKAQGYIAKAAAMTWLENRDIIVCTEKDPGSYDRYTANIYDAVTEESLTSYLLAGGYGVPYVYKWG